MRTDWILRLWNRMLKGPNQEMGCRFTPMSRHLAARVRAGDRGATTVELAVSAAVFLFVVFGIIDCSRALYSYHTVSHLAREATRYAIVRGSSCTSWASACPASSTDIQNYVQSKIALLDPNAVKVTTTWIPDNNPGSLVNVQVEYQFHFLLPFLPTSISTLTSSSQMVISQ
jgi:Flp pilus assembly protein TadG